MGAGFYEAAAHFDADPAPLKQLVTESDYLGRSDRDGLTLLHFACREGHLTAVVMLVEAGVALEVQDRDGRTPLHLACVMADQPAHLSRGRQHVEIAKYLIEAGAITSTPDKYHRVPLSYLPQSAKSLRLYTPKVSEPTAVWAIEEVTPGCAVPDGSVAQSSAIHLLRP